MTHPYKRKVWHDYIKSAIKRNYIFNLTFEDFISIVEQNCYYCKCSPNIRRTTYLGKRINIHCNGIDRIDNSIGYEITNCVPCCKQCNSSKARMSVDEFKQYIKTLYESLVNDEEIYKNRL